MNKLFSYSKIAAIIIAVIAVLAFAIQQIPSDGFSSILVYNVFAYYLWGVIYSILMLIFISLLLKNSQKPSILRAFLIISIVVYAIGLIPVYLIYYVSEEFYFAYHINTIQNIFYYVTLVLGLSWWFVILWLCKSMKSTAMRVVAILFVVLGFYFVLRDILFSSFHLWRYFYDLWDKNWLTFNNLSIGILSMIQKILMAVYLLIFAAVGKRNMPLELR